MRRDTGRTALLSAAAAIGLLGVVTAAVMHRDRNRGAVPQPSGAPASIAAVQGPVATEGALQAGTRRTRVTVLRAARDEAVAEAELGLADLAAARQVLRAVVPPPVVVVQPDTPVADAFVVSYHADGTEFRRGWMRRGKRDGFWSERFESGARVETFYRNGLRHGREAAWHPAGKPRFLGEYDSDRMTGTWTAWHPSGGVLSTRQYSEGTLHGTLRTFHESGVLAEESDFVEGNEVGTNRGWHENGQLAWQMTYVDGEREGPAVWYDADGHLLAEGVYVAGALHGLYVEYAPDGAVKGTEHWDRGRRVVQGGSSETE